MRTTTRLTLINFDCSQYGLLSGSRTGWRGEIALRHHTVAAWRQNAHCDLVQRRGEPKNAHLLVSSLSRFIKMDIPSF